MYNKNPPLIAERGIFFRFRGYNPMQLVVPSAVSIAEIIDAMICSVHFKVSFFVISNKL